MSLPTEFFTFQSFLTLTGAASITFVVTGVVRHVTCDKFSPRWFALLIAEMIAFIGVILTSKADLTMFCIGVLNGCLIYATALGISTVSGSFVEQSQEKEKVVTRASLLTGVDEIKLQRKIKQRFISVLFSKWW